MEQSNKEYFKITFDSDYDTQANVFAISVQQLGERYSTFKRENEPFYPSDVSIKLYSLAGDTPEVIKKETEYTTNHFMRSMIMRERTLEAGSYMIEVNIQWNS